MRVLVCMGGIIRSVAPLIMEEASKQHGAEGVRTAGGRSARNQLCLAHEEVNPSLSDDLGALLANSD